MSTYYQLLLTHTFSQVDDPQASDQNGTPKWYQSEEGYRVNPNYVFQSRATEISQLTLQYVIDHIGKAGAAVVQKPEQLFTAERQALKDFIVKTGGLESVVPKGKLVTLNASSKSLGCGEVKLKPASSLWIVKMLRFNWGYMLQKVFLSAAYDAKNIQATRRLWAKILESEDAFFDSIKTVKAYDQPVEAIPLNAEVQDMDSVLPSPYLQFRRIAVALNLPIATTEPFSRILLKLYNRLYHKSQPEEEDAKICEELNATWSRYLEGEKQRDQKKLEPQPTEPSFEFAIEQDWQGFFLHEFVRSDGFLALRFGLVPPEICQIALIAFGVTSEVSNPVQTLQLLLDRYVDKPTVLVAVSFKPRSDWHGLWNQPFDTILQLILDAGKSPA